MRSIVRARKVVLVGMRDEQYVHVRHVLFTQELQKRAFRPSVNDEHGIVLNDNCAVAMANVQIAMDLLSFAVILFPTRRSKDPPQLCPNVHLGVKSLTRLNQTFDILPNAVQIQADLSTDIHPGITT